MNNMEDTLVVPLSRGMNGSRVEDGLCCPLKPRRYDFREMERLFATLPIPEMEEEENEPAFRLSEDDVSEDGAQH